MQRATVWVITESSFNWYVVEQRTIDPLTFKRLVAEELEHEGITRPSDRLEFGPIGAPWSKGF